MRSGLVTAAILALGAAQHVQAQDVYIPERVATAVEQMQAPLVSTIKKYRYQPFCIAYLKCGPPSAADPTLTVTKSVATPTTIILSTGAGAIAIWEDEDLTMEGRATEVRNIAVETETSTHTTSITVGKFTQTQTVTKTITATPRMRKKRDVSQTEEDHAFAKRQAAACPALPANLQLGDQPFKDYEWNWIVENACAAAIPTALPTPKTRTETRLVGPSIRYKQAPTTTWTIPGVRNILGTDTTTIYYTATERQDTYEAVFSYTTKMATVTTTVTPRA